MRKKQLFLCPLEFSALLIAAVAVTLVNGDPMVQKSSEELFPEGISSEFEKLATEEVSLAKDNYQKDFDNSNDVAPFKVLNDKNPYDLVDDEASESRLSFKKPNKEINQYSSKLEYMAPVTMEDFEKRESHYDPYLKYMGLGKRKTPYNPALKYIGLGKRQTNYDPALKYMGLGKRTSNDDISTNSLDLEKRPLNYDPALKFMGLGKRSWSYDPALKYMGLGKRPSNYDPALKFMGLGKRPSNYDPALKFMGIGKRPSNYDPALKFMGLGKRASNYDPALKFMGLGKRASNYDPALKFMGLGKRSSNYDPALKFMGLEKRPSHYDPALKFMGLGKRSSNYDPALKFMGLGKRPSHYDPALKFMGLGKRSNSYDPGLKFMGLGKRNMESKTDLEKPAPIDEYNMHTKTLKRRNYYDPALKYMGLGKRSHEQTYDFSENYSGPEKRNNDYIVAYPTLDIVEDLSTQYSGVDDKLEDSNANFSDQGTYLNQRISNKYIDKDSVEELDKTLGIGKRPYKLDPAFQFMGLGKRVQQSSLYNEVDKRFNKYDPALRYMGLGKRKYSISTKSNAVNEDSPSYMFGDEEEHNDKAYHLNNDSENRSGDILFENKLNSSDEKYIYDPNVLNHNSDKLREKYDPSFLFMGLGKRGKVYDHQLYFKPQFEDEPTQDAFNTYKDLGKHAAGKGTRDKIRVDILELSKNASGTNECEAGCLMRKKRHITSKPVTKSQNFDFDKKFSDIFSTAKRERDRPRYNPGWIFIGLGKRDDAAREVTSEAEMDFDNKEKLNVILMNYYELLDKIKDKIKKKIIDFDDNHQDFSSNSKGFYLNDPHSKIYENMEDKHYSLQIPTKPSVKSHALTWLNILPEIPWDKM